MENKLFKMLLLGMFVLFSAYTNAQVQVSGTVKDNTGELLPGVSILVKGTTQGVVTDMDGRYSLAFLTASLFWFFHSLGWKLRKLL
jgi:hypothetical protein